MLTPASPRPKPIADRLLGWGFVLLPLVTYLGFLGLLGAIAVTVSQLRQKLWRDPVAQALTVLAIGLGLNVAVAFDAGEAALQLANFVPFFLLFIVTVARLQTPEHLYYLAWSLVFGSIPINVIGVLEYLLKIPAFKDWLDVSNLLLDWMYRHDYGHRANSVFGHPNAYVSYLILMLALGLGLILALRQRCVPDPFPSQYARRWLAIAIGLIGLGIFCAGSRNGLAITVVELLVVAIASGQQAGLRRWVIAGITLLGLGVLVGGVGGRMLTLDSVMTGLARDPRVGVWRIAVDLTIERPWLGWGMGNFKFLYPPRSFRADYLYVAHAHNFWLQCFAEMGMILTVLFCLIVGTIVYRGVRLYWQQTRANPPPTLLSTMLLAYLMGMGSFMLFAMLDVSFYDARINALNWLMVAAVYSLTEFARRSPPVKAS